MPFVKVGILKRTCPVLAPNHCKVYYKLNHTHAHMCVHTHREKLGEECDLKKHSIVKNNVFNIN